MDGVCDCHVHLYPADARWAATRPAVACGDLPAFRHLQQIASDRVVVVQPSLYDNDNGYTLSMVEAPGKECARVAAIALEAVSIVGRTVTACGVKPGR